MKPAPFEMCRPDSLEEVLDLLARYGDDAKLLAGGQSLVPAMNMRLSRPKVLIDLARVGGLDAIRADQDHVAIGAFVRQRAAERSETVQRDVRLLAQALPLVAHPAIRNRGTIGGSLAHADPAAEIPGVVLALDAEMVVVGRGGRRIVKAEEFFVSYLTTALAHDEVLIEVRVPRMPAGTRTAFVEMSRRHGDFAIVGVALALEFAEPPTHCRTARIAVIGLGGRPIRLQRTQRSLAQQPLTDLSVREASEVAAAEVEPESDLHASSHYRRRLTATLVERGVRQALGWEV
jgi:carbon-monoxide dehydrogenase medium subunit